MILPQDLDIDKYPVIVVLGATGSGKTTFVNNVSNSNLPVGHTLEPCTATVQPSVLFELNGYRLRLVDTPGDEDMEVLELIAQFLAGLYEREVTLIGLIYFQSISSPRISGINKRNMRYFREICGDAAMKKLLIVTTGINAESDTREEELRENPNFLQAAIQEGARLVRYDGTVQCAKGIVLHLLEGTENREVALRIQEELVDEGKGLSESAAGAQLDPELLKEIRSYERTMKESCSTETADFEKPKVQAEIKDLRALLIVAQAEQDQLSKDYNLYKSGQELTLLHVLILSGLLLIAWWVL